MTGYASSEEEAMIIRVFRPTIHPGKERDFESFLRETAVPLVSQQSGLVAQHVGTPRDPSSTEYLYVTVWEDVESIRAFAGEPGPHDDMTLILMRVEPSASATAAISVAEIAVV